MVHTIKEFCEEWGHEATFTLKILNALTDESLSQEVADGHRNLGRLAWHIVCTVPEMAERMGLAMGDFDHESDVPKTAGEIVAAYQRLSKRLIDAINLDWDDDTLTTEVDMYGEKWMRAFGLKACVDHQIHHRGQMTVLMRQAGIRVPSTYGPAKEDWAQMDMEPPAV